MDTTDKKILKILAENSNATATEIGNSVNLSVPAVNKRILKMSNDGTIRNFTIVTNPESVNKTVIAFISLVIKYGDNINTLFEYVNKEPDILECYSVTGEYDYIIKVCAKDIASLEDKILKIKNIKGVTKSHTVISLMEHKFTPTILPDEEEKNNE